LEAIQSRREWWVRWRCSFHALTFTSQRTRQSPQTSHMHASSGTALGQMKGTFLRLLLEIKPSVFPLPPSSSSCLMLRRYLSGKSLLATYLRSGPQLLVSSSTMRRPQLHSILQIKMAGNVAVVISHLNHHRSVYQALARRRIGNWCHSHLRE
jgi:hypothetical protein